MKVLWKLFFFLKTSSIVFNIWPAVPRKKENHKHVEHLHLLVITKHYHFSVNQTSHNKCSWQFNARVQIKSISTEGYTKRFSAIQNGSAFWKSTGYTKKKIFETAKQRITYLKKLIYIIYTPQKKVYIFFHKRCFEICKKIYFNLPAMMEDFFLSRSKSMCRKSFALVRVTKN